MPLYDEFKTLALPAAGHWQKKKSNVPRYHFGKGAKRDFSWYFEGASKIKVTNVTDVCKWLSRCKYVSDDELFLEDDFWQHPVTFEHLRKGDCEDHALWAWRKLKEIGVSAEFVCGRWLERKDGEIIETGHAWVNVRQPGNQSWEVLECTDKNIKSMIVGLKDAEKMYFPEVAIDGELSTYRFTIAHTKRRKAAGRKKV